MDLSEGRMDLSREAVEGSNTISRGVLLPVSLRKHTATLDFQGES